MNVKGEFLDGLELEYVDGRNWLLTAGFDYLDEAVRPGTKIDVPKGFVTDFASIPRIFWSILPPTGSYGKAAVIHDLLYRTGGAGATSAPITPAYSRAESDAVLRDAMKALGVPAWKVCVIYAAVRAFGRSSWKGSKA